MQPLPVIPIVPSIAPLCREVDAWLLDIWGVLHNGVAPFTDAVTACERFRSAGGTVLLVSNAPRPAASVAVQLDRIGVRRSAYDAIVSSGDTARDLLSTLEAAPAYHIGPERDLVLFEGLRLERVKPEAATILVCTGLVDDDTETPETYRNLLAGFLARRLPMICANPDIKVERGGKSVYCAGAIAALYADLGGAVTYAGKPFLPIYELAARTLQALRAAPVDKARILAIGDGAATDIAGAANFGVPSVYVASAVSMAAGQQMTPTTLAEVFPGPARPVAAMTSLCW